MRRGDCSTLRASPREQAGRSEGLHADGEELASAHARATQPADEAAEAPPPRAAAAGVAGALPQEAAEGGREPRAEEGREVRPAAKAIWSASSSPACLRRFINAPLNCSSSKATWLR